MPPCTMPSGVAAETWNPRGASTGSHRSRLPTAGGDGPACCFASCNWQLSSLVLVTPSASFPTLSTGSPCLSPCFVFRWGRPSQRGGTEAPPSLDQPVPTTHAVSVQPTCLPYHTIPTLPYLLGPSEVMDGWLLAAVGGHAWQAWHGILYTVPTSQEYPNVGLTSLFACSSRGEGHQGGNRRISHPLAAGPSRASLMPSQQQQQQKAGERVTCRWPRRRLESC